jgi:hypothetical protein
MRAWGRAAEAEQLVDGLLGDAHALPDLVQAQAPGAQLSGLPASSWVFEERLTAQMASKQPGRGTARYLWLEQDRKCLVCGQPLALEEGWQIHHLLWRSHGGDDTVDNRVLLHPNCHRQVHSQRLVVNKTASREGRS